MSRTFELVSVTGSLCYSIAYIFIAFGVCHAGWAYYKKVHNDKRSALYNKIFDIYSNYSNIISDYTHLINKDTDIDLNNPKYKNAQEQLYNTSRICMLVADNNLHLKISQFIDQFADVSNNQKEDKSKFQQEYLTQLLCIQNAMRDHLESIKFYQ